MWCLVLPLFFVSFFQGLAVVFGSSSFFFFFFNKQKIGFSFFSSKNKNNTNTKRTHDKHNYTTLNTSCFWVGCVVFALPHFCFRVSPGADQPAGPLRAPGAVLLPGAGALRVKCGGEAAAGPGGGGCGRLPGQEGGRFGGVVSGGGGGGWVVVWGGWGGWGGR